MKQIVGGAIYRLCLEIALTLGLMVWCVRKPDEAGRRIEENMEIIRRDYWI